MKVTTIFKQSLLGLALVPVLVLGTVHKAAAQIPYEEGVSSTSTTPVLNQYTGVPVTGNEADFVRLRVSNGDPRADAGTNQFVDPVNSTCNVGDQFDVRSYVHNGASQDFNNNGSGSAVAHNTTVALTAPINGVNNKFIFGSTISATGVNGAAVASVSDIGTLNCGSTVQLVLVPHTVYSSTKTGWNLRDDSAVNGFMKIGSRVADSGDVWGCWDERVMVVYTVKVVEKPAVVPSYTCDLITGTKIGDNKYRYTVTYSAKDGATFKNVSYVFSDGAKVDGDSTIEHTYAASQTTRKVTATANFTVNGETKSNTNDKCVTSTTTPQVLPSTGAGSTVAIFGITSVLGAFLYRMRALRSLR